MAAKPFVVAPSDYAPTLDIVGEHVTVLASGEQTESYEVFLQRGPEASGPPPHSHPWDVDVLLRPGRKLRANVRDRGFSRKNPVRGIANAVPGRGAAIGRSGRSARMNSLGS